LTVKRRGSHLELQFHACSRKSQTSPDSEKSLKVFRPNHYAKRQILAMLKLTHYLKPG
jgi:hypothetical protein